jgi:hypothetical protein
VHCREIFHQNVPNNAKGALGEALVAQYFEYAGWAVTRTGVENVVSHLAHLRQLDRGSLGNIPDMLVMKAAGGPAKAQKHPLGQAVYVEVKTWKTWNEGDLDFSRYREFGDVILVWISPEGLKGTWLSSSCSIAGANGHENHRLPRRSGRNLSHRLRRS